MRTGIYKQLCLLIGESAYRAFSELKDKCPDESFYAYALYATDDASTVAPSANSESMYTVIRREYGKDSSYTEDDLIATCRWSPFDWQYECYGNSHFSPVYDFLNELRAKIRSSQDFAALRACLFASMTQSMIELRASGFFDPPKEGDTASPTLFCSVTDSPYATWLETESAMRLNSPEAYELFYAERILFLQSELDVSPESDDVCMMYFDYLDGILPV